MTAALITAAAIILVAAALFLLYLFLINGRRSHPSLPDFFGRYYAHRGLFSNETPDAPENSLAAFRLAVGHGFGIELDVHISADGELFVMHDDSMKRMCGVDGKITECTSDEIEAARLLSGEQRIPHFSEVLALVSGKVPLIIELKCEPRCDPEPLCRAVSSMLASYRGAYCIESFNPYIVGWFKKNEPRVFRGQLAEAFFSKKTSKGPAAARFALENLWLNVVGRPDFVAYNCKHIGGLAPRLWRRLLRLPVACWTVRDEKTLLSLMEHGDCDCAIFEGFVPKTTSFVRK